jgi:hypothetical protein
MKQSQFRWKLGTGALIMAVATGCAGQITERINPEPQISNLKTDTVPMTGPLVEVPSTIVHIDPQTGKIITPAPGTLAGQIAQPKVDATLGPPSELYQTLSPVPGGGVMIHLDERFMTPSTATIDADGKVRFEHQSSVSDSNEKK